MLPENSIYGPWPLSGEPEWFLDPLFGTCLDASPISGEIDLMEARGNDPTYPAQYAERLSLFPPFPLLTETVFLQRHRRRSRVVELGSTDMAERCVEDVWLVERAAIDLR
jgi:hypothetical protein